MPLWSNWAAAYAQMIPNQIDLELIEHRLKDRTYKPMGDVRNDVHLLYNNALTCRGPGHPVTTAAAVVRDSLLEMITGLD